MMDLIIFALLCFAMGFVTAIGSIIVVFLAAMRFIKRRKMPKH